MSEILYNDLLKKIPNKYMLTIVAGKRARDILGGAKPLVETHEKDTIVKSVLTEILEDKVVASTEDFIESTENENEE